MLRSERVSMHAELPGSTFQKLFQHVRAHSRAYWIKGATPTRLKGYVVNGDSDPNVPPIQAQARKKSLALQATEKIHLGRETE